MASKVQLLMELQGTDIAACTEQLWRWRADSWRRCRGLDLHTLSVMCILLLHRVPIGNATFTSFYSLLISFYYYLACILWFSTSTVSRRQKTPRFTSRLHVHLSWISGWCFVLSCWFVKLYTEIVAALYLPYVSAVVLSSLPERVQITLEQLRIKDKG